MYKLTSNISGKYACMRIRRLTRAARMLARVSKTCAARMHARTHTFSLSLSLSLSLSPPPPPPPPLLSLSLSLSLSLARSLMYAFGFSCIMMTQPKPVLERPVAVQGKKINVSENVVKV
jgi:hypothetical protein